MWGVTIVRCVKGMAMNLENVKNVHWKKHAQVVVKNGRERSDFLTQKMDIDGSTELFKKKPEKCTRDYVSFNTNRTYEAHSQRLKESKAMKDNDALKLKKGQKISHNRYGKCTVKEVMMAQGELFGIVITPNARIGKGLLKSDSKTDIPDFLEDYSRNISTI